MSTNEVKLRLSIDGGAQVVQATGQAASGLDALGAAAARSGGGLRQMAGDSVRAAVAAERLSESVGRVGHYAALGAAAALVAGNLREMVGRADEFANMLGRLSLVTGNAADAQRRLFAIAQETRAGVSGLSEIFTKLAQSTEGSGISQQRLLNITRTMGQTMALSGGSAASMNAALVQLGQGMGSGVLRGEELNSVIEQMPALARAIGEGMGYSVKELKKLGEEGKITSEAIVQALEASAKKVETDFNRLPLTVGQALTQMQNALLQSVGVFDQANGLSRGLAESISAVSRNMDVLTAAATVAAGVIGGRLLAGLTASVQGMLAARAAQLADLQATVASTQARVAYTAAAVAAAQADIRRATGLGATAGLEAAATAATVAHTGALAAQTAAQTALNTATSIGARAVGLLGGPIGLITTALSVGAAAWALWGDSSGKASADAARAAETAAQDVVAALEKENAALARKIELLRNSGMKLNELSPAEEKRLTLLGEVNKLSQQVGVTEAEEITRRELLRVKVQELASVTAALTQQTALKTEADKLGGKWEERLLEIRMKLGGVSADYVKTLQDLAAAANADASRAAEYVALMAQVANAHNKTGEAAKSQANKYRELLDSYRKLAESTALKVAEDEAEAVSGVKLSDAQKAYVKVMADVRDGKAKLADVEKNGTLALLRTAMAQDAVNAGMVKERKAREEADKARADTLKSLDQAGAAQDRELQGLRDQYIELTAGKQVLAELVTLRLEDQAAMLQTQAIRALDKALDEDEYDRRMLIVDKLREQIALRKGIAAATADQAAANANTKAADDAAKEWQRASDQIGQSLADALMQGGKSAADYIKGLFRTMVLRPVIQGAVQPVANAVLGLLGGQQSGGPAITLQQKQALQQLVSMGSSAYNYGTAAYGWLTGAGAGGGIWGTATGTATNAALAESAVGTAGYGASSATAGAAASSGMSYAAIYAAIAVAVAQAASRDQVAGFTGRAARNAGDGLFGGNLGVGSVFADTSLLMQKIGLNQQWADILSMSTGFARVFGRGEAKVQSQGLQGTLRAGDFSGTAYADVKEKGGLFRSDKNYTVTQDLPEELARFMDTAAAAVSDKALAFGAALGLPADALAGITKDIKVQLGSDAEANMQAIVAQLAGYGDALVAGWADALKPVAAYGETTMQTIERVGAAIQATNVVLDMLGVQALSASVAGGQAAAALSESFGGLDQLAASASTYYQAYFSDAERAAASTRQVSAALADVGLSMPASRDAFRDMVEGLDLTVEAERAQFKALMQVAGAFAELNPIVEQTAETVRSASDVLKERQSLEAQELQLLGDTAALRARELAALDPANHAIQQRINRLRDQQAADAETAAKAKTAADQKLSLEQQELQLLGNTAALRALERAGLAEGNRELYDRVNALRDQQAADAQGSAQAKAAADQKRGLEQQELQLLGDTAELRRRELESLEPANRAIQERINRLRDEQAVATERAGLETRLLQLLGDTAELRRRELEALNPANRSLLERIFMLQDQQAADAKAAADAKTAADTARQAAENMIQAWQRVGDAIDEEVKRILGLVSTPQTNLATARADFAIATAQARAGDVSAAQRLPDLSRALLDLAADSIASSRELALLRASIAASLSGTLDLVRQPQAVPAMLDTSGAPVMGPYLPVAPQAAAGGGVLLAGPAGDPLLQRLIAEVQGLRDEARATAGHTAGIRRLATDWDGRGVLVRTEADTPLHTRAVP